MTKISTVIDCREQCKKLEKECLEIGKSLSECDDQRSKCERRCSYR